MLEPSPCKTLPLNQLWAMVQLVGLLGNVWRSVRGWTVSSGNPFAALVEHWMKTEKSDFSVMGGVGGHTGIQVRTSSHRTGNADMEGM